MIDELRNYFSNCPLLDDDALLGVDFLGAEEISYAINLMPNSGDGTIKRYIDGTKIKALNFTFACLFPYSKSTLQQIDNIDFFNKLMNWLDTNEEKPNINGFQKFQMVQTPTLNMVAENGVTAEYTVTLQLIYKERA